MEENNYRGQREEPAYTCKMKAGNRRTYFFDVKSTKSNDYYISITESKKRPDGSYERHKIYLYKEDFNRFVESINEVVNHVKTQLMPGYDFDEYSRRQVEYERQRAEMNNNAPAANSEPETPGNSSDTGNQSSSPAGNDDELKW